MMTQISKLITQIIHLCNLYSLIGVIILERYL